MQCGLLVSGVNLYFIQLYSGLGLDIHKMGKILLPYSWEILTHPSVLLCDVINQLPLICVM